jgi:hypothetical protein
MRGDFRRESVRDIALSAFQLAVRRREEVQSEACASAEYFV